MIEEIVEAESEEIINILKTNLIDNESSKYLKKKFDLDTVIRQGMDYARNEVKISV
ncbi:20047_t:CDS:2 [Rhizophagus irregularis]|nr:20047_t:CDS:2 [Rhizophagus irregularis]